ncbi:MAG TPA: hypothetical protein VL689_14900 [Paraburkholderia sp.]|jgi:hypothetical protein|nr:hypothetical protein [Paraburkholderia sp.]
MSDKPRQQPDPPASERTGKRPRHEGDEPIAQRDEQTPRSVGKQAHRDLERGLEDTALRGGGDYQERTQNDQHANRNSERERGNDGKED